jgi:SAM-dependent methyltransferase
MSDQILGGKSAAYRAASEALQRAPVGDRRAARMRALWDSGLFDLIRADYYRLFALPERARGRLLEAGCGTGIDAANLRHLAPGLEIHGVDISAVALAGAVARDDTGDAQFYQAALESLPFAASAFDCISSHEVIEHVEDPAAVLRELARVLKPGGVCVIATPNGASWWIEHLRQRVRRAFGRRGAPVGEDHTRPPSFWRREFARAGLVVERQIFDGAAIEFQMFVAPPRWIPALGRLLEPLRALPGLNLLLCDRVKFRLAKPGPAPGITPALLLCCPICRATLSESEGSESAGAVSCAAGHRFARNSLGLVDFSALAPAAFGDASPGSASAGGASADAAAPVRRSHWGRRARRLALFVSSTGYGGLLLILLPLGLIVRQVYRPFRDEGR